MPLHPTRARCLLPIFALVAVLPAAAHAQMVFHSVVDPAKADMGPGPDGLFGVGGDDDDLSAFGLNPNGSVSYVFLDQLPFDPPFDQLLNLGEGTLVLDAFPPEIPASVRSVKIEVVDSSNGAILFLRKRKGFQQSVQFFGNGQFFFDYTLASCVANADPATCDPFFEIDTSGIGWNWTPGETAAADIPGITATGFGEALIDFVEYIETLVPEETTVISMSMTAIITLDEDNTRGVQGIAIWGGTYFSISVFYSTDPLPDSIPCGNDPKPLCGKQLDLAGVEKLKIEDGNKTGGDIQLSPILGKRTWAGFDQRGVLHYGTYKAKDEDQRRPVLKYVLGDLGFLISFVHDAAFGEGLATDLDKKTAQIELLLNKKRTRVKEAAMKATGSTEVEAAERKVVYKVEMEGEASPALD